jgi:hypothetical protein
MRWSSFGSGTDVSGRGTFTFKPDLTDIDSLSDGGYLSIRTWSLFIPRTIEIHSEGGRLAHRYYVAGLSRRYDDDARRWLANELPVLVRRSGLGAEARTRQILAAGGVPAVLDEIKRLEGDYCRSLYFRELFGATRLDSTSLTRALALAGSVIESDFELSRTLRAAAPAAALDRGTVQAYVDSANDIHSDFERRRALVTLLQVEGAAAGTGDLVLHSAARMGSDFEKGIVLRSALETPAVDRAEALVPALRTMSSDFEKRRVISAVMARADLSADARKGLLAGAADIDSDFECATALIAFANKFGVEGATADPFFAALRTIDSAYETKRVLTAVAKKTPLAPEVSRGVFDTVRRMSSDFERAQVLLTMIGVQPLDATARSAFIAAAESISSTYEQNRVLAALVKAERR